MIQQFESHRKHPRRVVAGVGWDNERDLYVFDPAVRVADRKVSSDDGRHI